VGRLAHHRIAFKDAYGAQGEHRRDNARNLARRLLRRRNRPSAIFAASDTQALGVLDAAEDLQIAVPEALSVIGFDDIPAAAIAGLTTIRQRLFESGRSGARLLRDLMATQRRGPVSVDMQVELVVRSTTASPTINPIN